jgi:aromatic ring-opening dioxygenase catalytic subunit (LigB family)
MPSSLDAAAAFEFGRALAPLASEGVLIVGPGSLTCNRHALRFGMEQDEPSAEFARWVRDSVARGDRERALRGARTRRRSTTCRFRSPPVRRRLTRPRCLKGA